MCQFCTRDQPFPALWRIRHMGETKSLTIFRKHTDPLWIHNQFHTPNTPNATATFVKWNDRRYVVTCRHVISVLENLKKSGQLSDAALALLAFDSLEVGALSQVINVNPRVPIPQLREDQVDIALANIDDQDWQTISVLKNKTVIDLDQWREPNWNKIGYCVVAGYPDEHKGLLWHDEALFVTTKLVTAIVKTEEHPAPNRPEFTLHDHLGDLKGYSFSGMSGGPVYAVEGVEQRYVQDGELFPVGIAFEGHPSTNKLDIGSQQDNFGFLTQGDLCIRAYTLTPHYFEEWLSRTDLV